MNCINFKSFTVLVIAAAAAGAGIYWAQQHEVKRLREENQNLVSHRQTLTAERADALSALSEKTDELRRWQNDKNELLRLRGEIGLLRKHTKELEELSEQNRLLREALARSTAPTETEFDPQRRLIVERLNVAKQLVLGLYLFADDHGGLLPTGLSLASNYWGDSKSSRRLQTNQFELLVCGSLTNVPNPSATLAIRDRSTFLWDGKPAKVYGFADGHSEIKREPVEGFEAWEKEHMMPSATIP